MVRCCVEAMELKVKVDDTKGIEVRCPGSVDRTCRSWRANAQCRSVQKGRALKTRVRDVRTEGAEASVNEATT